MIASQIRGQRWQTLFCSLMIFTGCSTARPLSQVEPAPARQHPPAAAETAAAETAAAETATAETATAETATAETATAETATAETQQIRALRYAPAGVEPAPGSAALAPREEPEKTLSRGRGATAEKQESNSPSRQVATVAAGDAEVELQLTSLNVAADPGQAGEGPGLSDPRIEDARDRPRRLPLEGIPEPRIDVEPSQPLPERSALPGDRYPIDLSTALSLAGANNWQINLAGERVREAAARLEKAEVLWVPSLIFGPAYSRHDGTLQGTDGEIVNVSRQNFFLGGGPLVSAGGAPLSGSAINPRLFVGLNPAEAYFAPLAARQSVAAAGWEQTATFNDTLLEVGISYYDLVQAQQRVAIAEEVVRNSEELAQLTRSFADVGAGLEADALRARALLADARAELIDARQEVQVVSAHLAWLLRLDPSVELSAVDPLPIPVSLVSPDLPLQELIAQGRAARPELAMHQYAASEAQSLHKLERVRPWVPNVFAGNSAGGFGGGRNSSFGEFDLRNDFELVAVWEVENLGLGNRARQRERASQERQEWLKYHQQYEQVAADVTQAHARVQASREQVEVAREQVFAAAEALPLNFMGIRGGELRPIEAQQAIEQLAVARRQYLKAVITYDQAQLQLLRAVGSPPHGPPAEAALEWTQPQPVPPAPPLMN